MRRRCNAIIFAIIVIAAVVFVTEQSTTAVYCGHNIIDDTLPVKLFWQDEITENIEDAVIADEDIKMLTLNDVYDYYIPQEPEPEPEQEEVVEETAPRTYYDEIPLSADLQEVIFEAAATYGVSAALILGIIEVESNFNTGAVSSSGCYGLMQLSGRYFGTNLSPADNIRTGTKEIVRLINKYGSIHKALVCYNCGEGGAKGISSSSYSNKVVGKMEKWETVLND